MIVQCSGAWAPGLIVQCNAQLLQDSEATTHDTIQHHSVTTVTRTLMLKFIASSEETITSARIRYEPSNEPLHDGLLPPHKPCRISTNTCTSSQHISQSIITIACENTHSHSAHTLASAHETMNVHSLLANNRLMMDQPCDLTKHTQHTNNQPLRQKHNYTNTLHYVSYSACPSMSMMETDSALSTVVNTPIVAEVWPCNPV